ncbi:MAG: T9SS type A sorting domain-containing protein [Chitinophagales bacterium]|nr:T9SS type A sorting domain-containing protein [Chitinophagales bacterium]
MKSISLLLVVFFLPASAAAQFPSFLAAPSWSHVWNETGEEDLPEDPGYWEQYFRMKKDASGHIPRLPYAAIAAQQQQSGNRDEQLFNIQELGPDNIGGRTRAILLDADNSDHLFAAGISGGIWFSADSGKNWTAVNDYLSSLSISSLAQDHFNHDIIYAATGEGAGNSAGIPGNGIYKSTDHGVSFSHLPSTDGTAFNTLPRIATSPVDSNGFYVATGGSGLYHSADGGESLNQVYSTDKFINDMEVTPSGGVWMGVNGAGLYYSASGDSGTFEQVTSGLPSSGSFARIEIAQAPSDSTVLYAAFEKSGGGYYSGIKGIYKSTDAGISWTTVGNPDVDFAFYMSFPWYSMTMAVKPDNPDYIVFGVGDVVYSSDGGLIWKKCINIHVDHHVTVFNPDKPSRLYQGNDGGIYRMRTDQIGFNQTDLNHGYNTIQYYAGSYFPSGINAIAGAQDNGTHSCLAANPTFNEIFGGDGSYNAVNQQYPTIAYVSYQDGTIHRADDADYAFPTFYPVYDAMDNDGDGSIDDGAWFINPFEINLSNGDQLLFVTQTRVWQTLDGGFAWEPVMNPIAGGNSPYAIGLSHDFSATIYVGGEKAIFYRIDDGYNAVAGDEVNLSSSVPSSITNDFISNITVHPADKSICYVSFSNFSEQPRLWKVTNGTTAPVWTSISGDLPEGLPVNYIEIDPARPDDFFLAGTDYGLYLTTDGGQHWIKDNTIPNVVVQQVKVRSSDRRVFIFTHGRGMWTAVLDPNSVGMQQLSSNNMAVSVYPNPFLSTLFIKSAAAPVAATLRDMNGRIMHSEAEMTKEKVIDLHAIPAGIYLLELKSSNHVTVRKITKE